MIGLLRPYRGKVALMFVALLVATGAGLAPPYLAGQAIDSGILAGDVGALDLIVAAFVVVADPLRGSPPTLQTYLVGWVGTRALQDLRERVFAHLQTMSIGFFTRAQPGRPDLAHDQRHRGAQPARHRRHRDAVLEHPDPARRGRDPARCSTCSWRWSPSSPSRCWRSPASSSASSPPAPTGRPGSGSPRSPPTCRRR